MIQTTHRRERSMTHVSLQRLTDYEQLLKMKLSTSQFELKTPFGWEVKHILDQRKAVQFPFVEDYNELGINTIIKWVLYSLAAGIFFLLMVFWGKYFSIITNQSLNIWLVICSRYSALLLAFVMELTEVLKSVCSQVCKIAMIWLNLAFYLLYIFIGDSLSDFHFKWRTALLVWFVGSGPCLWLTERKDIVIVSIFC